MGKRQAAENERKRFEEKKRLEEEKRLKRERENASKKREVKKRLEETKRQLGDFVPQVSHDLLVLLESGFVPVTLTLDDGVADGEAFEVIFVQCTVAVNVVHVPDDELDTVIPRVSHF